MAGRCLMEAAGPGSWPGGGGEAMNASDFQAAGRPARARAWRCRWSSRHRAAARTPQAVQLARARRRPPQGRRDSGRPGPRPPAADAGTTGRRLAAARPPVLRRSVPAGRRPSGRRGRCGGPRLPREDTMPEPAAPRPDPGPATTRPRPSPNGTGPPEPPVPPMPSEVTTNGTVPPKPPVPPMPSEVTTARTQRPAAGMFRTAMSPLRKMMRRAPAMRSLGPRAGYACQCPSDRPGRPGLNS
jgi:hypothetical protein